MTILRRLAMTVAIPILSAAGLVAVAAPDASAGCPTGTIYTTSDGQHYFIPKGGNYTTNGPAEVTLSVSVTNGTIVTGTVTGSVSFSLSAILASATATFGGSFAISKTSSVTTTGSWTPETGHGWLAWGAWGYAFDWQQGHYDGGCHWIQTGSGEGIAPNVSTGFDKGYGYGPPGPPAT